MKKRIVIAIFSAFALPSLALTSAILYLVCAAAFALRPQGTLEFFSAWFHGLNLRALEATAQPFTSGVFFYGLSGVTLSGFAAGILYAFMHRPVSRCLGCRGSRG
ncbi:MAG: DUF5676 family membrane protein [Betaproteobacteria bacterium]|nr:DUF5676 family membrane protein [Betaproteobacteria bacterium]